MPKTKLAAAANAPCGMTQHVGNQWCHFAALAITAWCALSTRLGAAITSLLSIDSVWNCCGYPKSYQGHFIMSILSLNLCS